MTIQSLQEQTDPILPKAEMYIITVFQAIARDNYAENQQCESISICPGVMMEAKIDLQ